MKPSNMLVMTDRASPMALGLEVTAKVDLGFLPPPKWATGRVVHLRVHRTGSWYAALAMGSA